MTRSYWVMLLILGLNTACGSSKSSSNDQPAAPATGQTINGSVGQTTNTNPTYTANPANPTNPPPPTVQTTPAACRGCSAVVIADSIGTGLYARYPYQVPIIFDDATAFLSVVFNADGPDQIRSNLVGTRFTAQTFSGYDGRGASDYPSFQSFLTQLGVTGSIYDVSKIGATITNDALSQIGQAQVMAAASTGQINVVVLALGNNDFCSDYSGTLAAYGTQLQQTYLNALQSAASTFSRADIYAVSPVNVPNLQYITAQGTISLQGLGISRTCASLQNLYCPEITQPDANAKIQTMVTAMKNAAQIYANAHSGAGRKIYFADVSQIAFTTDQLAVDCFHPSIKGQQTIANTMMSQARLVLPAQ